MRIDQLEWHNLVRCAPHSARLSRRRPMWLHGDARIDILGICSARWRRRIVVGDESGECAAELVALASLDGCGEASSAAALIAKAPAKDSISVKETNFSFS